MKLTKAAKDRVVNEWHAAPRHCPICGVGAWQVADRLFVMDEYRPPSASIAMMPFVVLVCSECSSCVLVSYYGFVDKEALSNLVP